MELRRLASVPGVKQPAGGPQDRFEQAVVVGVILGYYISYNLLDKGYSPI